MNEALRQRLIDFRDAMPLLTAEKMAMTSELILRELEDMTPEERVEYAPEIASLISQLESRILGLEQALKDTQN